MSDKNRVKYDYKRGVMQHSSGGVILWPLNHPNSDSVSNESYVLTSKVLHFDENTAIIETLNTIYEPNAIE